MYRYLYLLSLLIFAGCSQPQQVVTQLNVIPGALPDPSVIEVDGTFYASGTSGNWGPVYPIYKSNDLKSWTFVSYVFQEKPEWTINSFWAPELYYYNDTYYCYYTARRTDGVSCIGVATTKNLEDGFTDHGVIIDWGNEAIDAFVYNENGKLYIIWKAYGLDPQPIQLLVSELSEDGLSLVGEPTVALTTEFDTWEAGMMEGQCIVPHGDYLYMIYSGNSCCGPGCNYMVGVARAKSMKGPWEKYEQNPILKGNDSWKCPGHGTAVQKGDQWYYLYHAYHSKTFPYLGRTALLSSIQWDEETGWPSFESPTDSAAFEIKKENIYDNFEDNQLAYWWHQPVDKAKADAHLENKQLVLVEGGQEKDSLIDNVLCVIPHDISYTATTEVAEMNSSLKGLVLYANSRYSMGFGVKEKQLIVWKVEKGNYETLAETSIDANNPKLFLQAKIEANKQVTFRYSFDNSQWTTIESNKEETSFEWFGNGFNPGLFVKTFDDKYHGEAKFQSFQLEY